METNSIGAGACEWRLAIRADFAFSQAEASDIGMALMDWNRASDGRICFDLRWMLFSPEYEKAHWSSDGRRSLYSGDREWQRRAAMAEGDPCNKPGACAAVTIWEAGNVADVFYFNRSRDGFLSLTEHELGHLLGLDHSDDVHDVMYHKNTSNNSTCVISAADKKELGCLMNAKTIGAFKNPCRKPATRKRTP
jgi:hypothetical protein